MTYLDEPTRPSLRRIVLLAVACVLALVLPFVLIGKFFGEGTAAAPPKAAMNMVGAKATAGHGSSASATTSALPTGVDARGLAQLAATEDSCRVVNLRQQTALSAADVSMAQFQTHIEAMNLLVAGKISLAAATTFWDQTRIGATQNVAAFRSADEELTASASGCTALDKSLAAAAPYARVVAVTDCVDATSSRDRALARARKVVATWEHHVHDMEMLRMGQITPAQATAAWQRNWKAGQKELSSYKAAARSAQTHDCTLS
jgi:hypothetical protein